LAEGESVLYMADIVREGALPRLINKKEIMRAKAPECTLEAQDFRKNDNELIYTCYRSPFADVFGVDLASGTVTTYRKLAGEYNEVEGISPDGQWTLVESSRDQGPDRQSGRYVDLWRLRLEPEPPEIDVSAALPIRALIPAGLHERPLAVGGDPFDLVVLAGELPVRRDAARSEVYPEDVRIRRAVA